MFEHTLVRFAVSGTLITCYGLADLVVRRLRKAEPPAHAGLWVRIAIAVSLGAFYCLIGPTGGPLLSGKGNVLGIAIVALAIALRISAALPHSGLASRCLFYLALPIAVGVPWGLLVLTLPASVLSLHSYRAARAGGVSARHGASDTGVAESRESPPGQ